MTRTAPAESALRGTQIRAASAGLVASAFALWAALWLFAHTNRTLAMRGRQIALFFAAFGMYLIALALLRLAVRSGSDTGRLLWFIIAAGIVFRLTAAPVRAVTSTDIYRYLWEGRLVRLGVNPYAEPPDSPRLAQDRDWVWPLVQHKDVSAAYPPVAQYVFAGAGCLPGNRVTNLKLVLALFDVASVLLLPCLLVRLGVRPAWSLVYAWHPLIVGEVVARGHLDTIGIFFLVLSLRLLSGQGALSRVLSGAFLAASVLAKGYAIVTVPFLVLAARPRRAAFAGGLLLTALVVYLPFLSAGAGLFGGAAAYVRIWQGNASVFALVKLAFGGAQGADTARLVCGLMFATYLLYLIARAAGTGVGSLASAANLSFLALAGFFILSPAVYPWYLAWTVPFLCLRARPGWLLLTGTIFGFYAHDFAGHHAELWWVTVLEYGLPAALGVGAALCGKGLTTKVA